MSVLTDTVCVSLSNYKVDTPVYVDKFERVLVSHPNRDLVRYVLGGLRDGFSIGVGSVHTLGSGSSKNNFSALRHKALVSEAISREVSNGFLAGPFAFPSCSPFHCSPISAALKLNGLARLILDMSGPRGML